MMPGIPVQKPMAPDFTDLLKRHATPISAIHTTSYDAEADVLYVHFREGEATDSELTEDDVIVRYDGEEVIGLTILRASKR